MEEEKTKTLLKKLQSNKINNKELGTLKNQISKEMKNKKTKEKGRSYLVEIVITSRKIISNVIISESVIKKAKEHYEKNNSNLQFNIFTIYEEGD